MNRIYKLAVTAATAVALSGATVLAAQATTGESLAFAGGLFSFASPTLTATNSLVTLTYNGAAVSGTYYLTFSGTDASLNSLSSTMTNISWSISQNSNGSSPLFTATASKGTVTNIGNAIGILGNYVYTGSNTSPLNAGPSGSYGLTLSGWNGKSNSPSGSGGTFTPATPEASTSMSMAGLLLGGALLGIRKRRKARA